MFNVPPAVLGTLLVLIGIHAARLAAPDRYDNEILLRLSFLPGTFTYAFDPAGVMDAMRSLAMQGDAGVRQAQLGRYILTSVGVQPWAVLTYGLLHADWTHIGLNGLWLLAFGSPLAWRLGTLRFLVFLAMATVAGALAHYATHPFDLQPVIGASAAVSGCMGAALRFMFQPERPLSALVGWKSAGKHQAFQQPLLSLLALFRNRRALAFLGAWFLANALFGIGTLAFGASDATIAWQAHIGGFLLGLLALPIFDRRWPSEEPPRADELPPGDVNPAAP